MSNKVLIFIFIQLCSTSLISQVFKEGKIQNGAEFILKTNFKEEFTDECQRATNSLENNSDPNKIINNAQIIKFLDDSTFIYHRFKELDRYSYNKFNIEKLQVTGQILSKINNKNETFKGKYEIIRDNIIILSYINEKYENNIQLVFSINEFNANIVSLILNKIIVDSKVIFINDILSFNPEFIYNNSGGYLIMK